MRFSIGSVFSWAFALVPTAVIGGIIWYFIGFGGGSDGSVVAKGFGPTILGIVAVGSILLVQLVRSIASGAATATTRAREMAAALPPPEAFDADDVFARYMAKRDSGEIDAAPPLPEDAPPPAAPRPQFGRRIS